MVITIKKQQGMSLIEIMIALTISLIIILAILRAYVSVGYVSAETTRGATIDANIMKGLMIADRILQGAGYNTVAPTDSYGETSDKLIQAYYSGAANTVLNTAADAIVWKLSSGNCQALKSTGKGLAYYGGTGYSCTGPTLPAATEPVSQMLISTVTQVPNSVVGTVGNISLKITKLAGTTICTPFGAQATAATASGGKYYVEITASIYATSTSTTASTISSSTCLFNIVT